MMIITVERVVSPFSKSVIAAEATPAGTLAVTEGTGGTGSTLIFQIGYDNEESSRLKVELTALG